VGRKAAFLQVTFALILLSYIRRRKGKVMRKISAGRFKNHCLTILDEVRATRNPVLITKRGRPVAKLVPADSSRDNFIGRLEGRFKVAGDIESPVEPPESWEVLR
jgi:prevent-host-death family protein